MLSNSEILLDQVFRVWIRGDGYDYNVVLTPVSLLLEPTKTRDPDLYNTPICCICPAFRKCGGRSAKKPCGPGRFEIQGRDIVSCYPANQQPPSEPEGGSGGPGKNLDLKVTGYPVFMLVAYPPGKTGKRKRIQLHFHLMQKTKPEEDADIDPESQDKKPLSHERRLLMNAAKIRDTWVHAITTSLMATADPTDTAAVSAAAGGPARLLVVINPASGKRHAMTVAARTLLPILHESGLDYEILLTDYPGHAQHVMRHEASARWRGIVTVSGDGIVHEVLNGLFERPDWREAMDSLPLGIVPAGSGNALARSLIHQQKELFNPNSQVISCSVNVSKSGTTPLDLMFVETPYMTRVCAVSITWGLIADVDIDSESLRALGQSRFVISALEKIAKKQVYRARVSYIPLSMDTVDTLERSSGSRQGSHNLDGVDNEVFEDDENVDTEDIIKELRRSQDDLDNASSSSNDEDNELGNSAAEEDDIEENGDHPEDESQDQPDEGEPPLPPSELFDMGQSTQPPGTYLVPKHVSYGTMLAQGQLYARSWLELQSRVLRPDVIPMEGYPMQEALQAAASPPGSTVGGGGSALPPPCPKHGYMPQMPQYMMQQATANSSTYSTAAAALKRAEDHTRPYFKDLPPLSEEIEALRKTSTGKRDGSSSSQWIVESSEYLGASIVNVPYLSSDFMMAPDARLSDSSLYLVLFRGGMNRTGLLKLMDQAKKGSHVKIPGVEVIPVQAARIEPLPNGEGRGQEDKMGRMALDGELVETTAIQAHVMPKVAKVFTK